MSGDDRDECFQYGDRQVQCTLCHSLQHAADFDVVVILLPAGRRTHIELGMALALQRKVFLCSATEEEFSVENTVNFYQLPDIIKLTGAVDENIGSILAQ